VVAAPTFDSAFGPVLAIPNYSYSMIALVLRPGVGVWHGGASDGARTDADEEPNGFSTLAVATMEQLGGGPEVPFTALQAGDTVAAIDPRTLEVWTTVVE
jgi:hypothetical protein